MKKILFILLLTSCAGYKTLNKAASSQQTRDDQWLRQQDILLKQQSFNLLEQYAQRDSLAYDALILTEGPYQISADSGIRGTGARIWLSGTRQRYEARQKQQDSSWLDSQQNRVAASNSREEKQEQSSKASRHASLNAYWLMAPVLLIGLLWFLWRRK